MKILQITAAYKPAYIYGGPTMSVARLCEQLVKANCQVSVYTTTANGSSELEVVPGKIEIVDGVAVTYFKRLTKDHSHFSPALLRSVWKNIKLYDAIHIHAWWNTVSVLSCLIAVIKGIPVIVSPRGTLSNYSFHNKNAGYKKSIHYLLGKPLFKRCFIHATSHHEKAALNTVIAPKRIFNIPNFIALPPQAVQKEPDPGPVLKLIFLSRIEEKKGLDILLQALTHLTIPYHLTIAGTGKAPYIDYLKQIIIKNNSVANISWTGFLNEDKFTVLGMHHLLILPSHDENFGNVVIESLSVGTPVLISDQVGLADYIVDKQLGWICQTTPQSIADSINGINRQQLNHIRKIAPEIIYRDFNEGNLLQQYLIMYQKIIKND